MALANGKNIKTKMTNDFIMKVDPVKYEMDMMQFSYAFLMGLMERFIIKDKLNSNREKEMALRQSFIAK